MVDDQLCKHVRSAQFLGNQVAAEGRHEDAWRILKESVSSVIAARPGSPDHKMLKLAVRLAEQQKDMGMRTQIMQQACHEFLHDKKQPNQSKSGQHDLQYSSAIALGSSKPGTPTRKRSTTAVGFVGFDRPSIANGLSRAESQPCHRPRSSQSTCSVGSKTHTDPRFGPKHLQQYLKEVSDSPPDGRSPIYRASSAPYLESTPHAWEPYFSSSQTEDGRLTSHYSSKGGPRTNSHYKNGLPGANKDFDDGNPWKTSNQTFQRNAHLYDLDPACRVSRDSNFQYVNGDRNQGIANMRQRMKLPAYHRTQAEINGLPMAGR